ncbi:hypothetical protein AAC387_Pa09g1341 [Persea americana]
MQTSPYIFKHNHLQNLHPKGVLEPSVPFRPSCNKTAGASLGSKFLLALDKRSTKECGQERIRASPGSPSVKAF